MRAALRIALVAGEASGDQLGAGLIDALHARFPQAVFAGIGGPAMRTSGLEAWYDSQDLAVMGLSEVLAHLPRLLRLRSNLRKRVLAWQPDIFIGIDAPDFNLGVERWLKNRGVRTAHYVSPSVWAWREKRAAKIGGSADRVLCLFPMEPAIYARHHIDACFVGHPLADAIPLDPDRNAARVFFSIDADVPVLAVLPGSRLSEIGKMLPIFLDAADLIAQSVPRLQVLLPAANHQCADAIRTQLQSRPETASRIRITDGDAQNAMIASDVVLLASGTAALEGMLCKRPIVVGHRIAPTTYRIVKTFNMLKSRFVSLPNVLADAALIPELLQDDCTPEKLAAAVLRWLGQPDAVAALVPQFRALHEQLRLGASERAADAIAQMLSSTKIDSA